MGPWLNQRLNHQCHMFERAGQLSLCWTTRQLGRKTGFLPGFTENHSKVSDLYCTRLHYNIFWHNMSNILSNAICAICLLCNGHLPVSSFQEVFYWFDICKSQLLQARLKIGSWKGISETLKHILLKATSTSFCKRKNFLFCPQLNLASIFR